MPLASAQDAQPSDNPLADLLEPRVESRLPSADEAMDAFSLVAARVREWGGGDPVPCPAAAVRVSLYQAGRLLGWGSSMADTAGEEGAVGQAATGAMEMAARALLPRPDALAAEQLRTLAGGLTVSLELAGPFTPMGSGELANPDATIRPGLDGLAVRVEGEWLIAFPSEILASGVPAGVRLPAMAARLLGDPTLGIELPIDLASQHGVTFYRFEALHAAGVGPAGSAAFVSRGGSLVQTRDVTTEALAGFAEAMLAHLEAACIRGEGRLGLMGPLDAAHGQAEGIASPMQQSLVALALVRLAETPRVSAAVRERANALARRIMADLAVVEPIEVAPADDGVAAAVVWVVLAELDAAADPDLAELFSTCESMLAEHAAAERGEMTPTVFNAILVWALAERAALTGEDAEVASRDLRALYRATPPGGLVGLMPWLGWAELRLVGDAPLPAQAALRQVRDEVWDHQLGAQDTGFAEADLTGGIVFTRGVISLPTWASARPVALCATMLGDPRLTTDAEAPAEVVRLIDAARFLRQLSARDVECAFYPRPDLARGGVRAALWDQTMPPEATAMTMLAVSEFLRSLDALQARQKQAQTPDPR